MTPESDAVAPSVQSSTDLAAMPDAPEGVACDFCGEVVDSVRRVALDGDYERLRTRHQPRYSCGDCFDKKEKQRHTAAG